MSRTLFLVHHRLVYGVAGGTVLLPMCLSPDYVMVAGNVFIIIVHDGGVGKETKELNWWSIVTWKD